jgi:hypothetical protein
MIANCMKYKDSTQLSVSLLLLLIAQLLFLPSQANAVLPPDLIVSAGAQLVGVFSLLAAVVVSLFTSLGILYVSCYEWFKKWSVYIAFGVLVFALLLSNSLFMWQMHSLEQPVVITQNPTDLPSPEPRSVEMTAACLTCQFYSESITLFFPDTQNTSVVEVDLNRRQEADTSFSHYYFLDGFLDGQSLDAYTQFDDNGSELVPAGFLEKIAIVDSVDASVRRSYGGVILAQDSKVSFKTVEVLADFVTRNTPEYTQFQSPVVVEVYIDDEQREGYALVETLHSTDYEQRIFFPGYDSLEALTYQFVLWDSERNFYMIDKTDVFSDTPAYPSHSWLLYKNANSGAAQKGFKTEVLELRENSWRVTVPDFENGIITVSSVETYKDSQTGRTRKIVSGTIIDNNGEREISGLLRIVR